MDTVGSDHFPIYINMQGYRSSGNRLVKVINWDVHRSRLESVTVPLQEVIPTRMDYGTTSAFLPHSFSRPDLKLLNLCAARRRSQKTLQRKGSVQCKTEFNRINAAVR